MSIDVLPAFEDVRGSLEAGRPALITARRIDDLETPVSAYLKLAGEPGPRFLLESVEGGAYRGRYSAIGLDPDLIWRLRDGTAEIARSVDPLAPPARFEADARAPMESLAAEIEAARVAAPAGTPPLVAGLFGYLGYDFVRLCERLPDTAPPDPVGAPDALLVRPRVMVVFDALSQEILAAAPVRPIEGQTPREAYDAAARRVQAVFDRLDRAAPARAGAAPRPAPEPSANMTPDTYKSHVEAARDYVRAGDVFQVVLSQRFSAPLEDPPFSLYRSLRRTNPSPFLFFFDFNDFCVTGSSPEILVRVRDGVVTVRPIAGTRPRGATPDADDAFAEELAADEKERAEHLMLLDLGRNDVARVAEPGSVRVTQRETVERYSHVMHLVSNVEGDLREGETALSALLAGFPAGTVSGAPKVRAMEIIEEREPHRRGVYSGAVGYFGADGGLDTCIALRTAVIKDGVMHVQAGAGLVLDSDPDAEHQECRNKAAALFRAAAEAWRFR